MADSEALPVFTYHPDPVATGSVVPSQTICQVCGRPRGYIYVGPVYGLAELDDLICPWCVADSSAHERFDVEFTVADEVGREGTGTQHPVPQEVVEEIAYRTPGIRCFQQARWWAHCSDGALFLGPADAGDLTGRWRDAVDVIAADSGHVLGTKEWEAVLRTFNRDGWAEAYVFRCRHCGRLGGYWDCN